MRRVLPLSAFLAAAPALADPTASAPGYHLHFTHEARVGEQIEQTVSISNVYNVTVRLHGKTSIRQSALRVQATYQETATEVDPDQRATLVSVVCHPFLLSQTANGPLKPAACDGAELVITRWPTYRAERRDGKPLSKTELSALRFLIPPARQEAQTEDSIFHPPDPVHVGDHWSVTGKNFAAALSQSQDTPFSSDATATVTVSKIVPLAGRDCLSVHRVMKAPLQAGASLQKLTVDHGQLSSISDGLYAADGASGILQGTDTVTVSVQAHADTPLGPAVVTTTGKGVIRVLSTRFTAVPQPNPIP